MTENTCTVPGCDQQHYAKGICKTHYTRLQVHGSTLPDVPVRRIGRPLAERLWAKVDKTGDCWEWTASRKNGYGQIVVAGKLRTATRVVWELHHGPIPDGMYVCHRCDNPPCVRPEHLFLGTQADNMADARAKGRTRGAPPEKQHARKLSDAQVAEIRLAVQTESPVDVAARYGLAAAYVYRIRKGTVRAKRASDEEAAA